MANNENLASVDHYDKPLSNLFILDLESRPQESLWNLCLDEIKPSKVLKDPDKIAADVLSKIGGLKKTMSVDSDYAEIICIGVKRLGEEGRLYTPKEMEVFFKENPLATFITFNGKSFDIPLLIKFGLKNGLDYPYRKLKEMMIKWRGLNSIDLMEIVCDRDYKSLDLLLQIYLNIKKTPIDFATASEEEIKIHCLEDVANTEKLYNVFKEIC